MSMKEKVPTHLELMKPTLDALLALGNSGTNTEINEIVYEILNLPDEILNIQKNDSITLIDDRLAWARSYLKMGGYIENSQRGVWAILPSITKEDVEKMNPRAIQRKRNEEFRKQQENKAKIKEQQTEYTDSGKVTDDADDWEQILYNTLIEMTPSGFENLFKRVLRELGFTQVEVTGKSGDGGIDGKGIVKISGVLSFHVLFQCKKYQNPITPSQIRDFRGAMQGRADKGLFVTTSTFTREALREATRDGAPPIDIIGGEDLFNRLLEW